MVKIKMLTSVVSAAAILMISTSFNSYAANGWVEEDNGWTYYDSDGNRVTETWKKNGNNWFYLDDEGNMVLDSLVDDGEHLYYVDINGAMITNQWIQQANEDDGNENTSADNWYYFQSNGRAYQGDGETSFKTINGKKYAFDNDGKMLYGWVNENSELMSDDYDWKTATYYCGADNDGSLVSGWRQITVENDKEDKEGTYDYWFYFKSNGKKTISSTKTINGEKYIFDENGMMETEWVQSTPSTASGNTAEYQYFNYEGIGSRMKGWFYAVPDENIDKKAYDNQEEKWFYASNGGTIAKSEFKTINGKKYAFDKSGIMLTGLQAIVFEDSGSKIKSSFKLENETELLACNAGSIYNGFDFSDAEVYYFGTDDSEDGFMRTGSQNVYFDGEDYSYLFGKSGIIKGKGYGSEFQNNNKDIYDKDGTLRFSKAYVYNKDSIYVKGMKAKAESDVKYQAFLPNGLLETNMDNVVGNTFLVNSSGSIVKNKQNTKNADEIFYCTDSNGIITYVGNNKCKEHKKDAQHE